MNYVWSAYANPPIRSGAIWPTFLLALIFFPLCSIGQEWNGTSISKKT